MKIVNYVLLQDAQTKILPVVSAVISCLSVPNAVKKIMQLAKNRRLVQVKKLNVPKVCQCRMAQVVLNGVNVRLENVFLTAKLKVCSHVCAIPKWMLVCVVADRISIQPVFQSWMSKGIRIHSRMVLLATKDLATKWVIFVPSRAAPWPTLFLLWFYVRPAPCQAVPRRDRLCDDFLNFFLGSMWTYDARCSWTNLGFHWWLQHQLRSQVPQRQHCRHCCRHKSDILGAHLLPNFLCR